MRDLQCILSSRLMPGREFGAPVSDGGDSYYPVRVPSAGFGENERDMWDIVYVPAYLLTAVKFTPDETDYEIFGPRFWKARPDTGAVCKVWRLRNYHCGCTRLVPVPLSGRRVRAHDVV